MLEVVRNLLRELNAILRFLHQSPYSAVEPSVLERIQEAVLAWSVNVRPGLLAIKVPVEVLARADKLTARVARLAADESIDNEKIAAALSIVRTVIHEQILLEVARIPAGVQAAFSAAAPAVLFPEIFDLPNELVPYGVQGWTKDIRRFLKRSPFGKNVFIMVAYRARLEPLINAVKSKVRQLRLKPVLARDVTLTNDLYNPIACLLCCSYGVAIFDRAEAAQTHNPNVVYELGMMQLLKRPCVILKHTSLKKMPTDLLSMLYEDYSSKQDAVRKLGAWWARTHQ